MTLLFAEVGIALYNFRIFYRVFPGWVMPQIMMRYSIHGYGYRFHGSVRRKKYATLALRSFCVAVTYAAIIFVHCIKHNGMYMYRTFFAGALWFVFLYFVLLSLLQPFSFVIRSLVLLRRIKISLSLISKPINDLSSYKFQAWVCLRGHSPAFC